MKKMALMSALFIFVMLFSFGSAHAEYMLSFVCDDGLYNVSGTLVTSPDRDGSFSVTSASLVGTGSSNAGLVYSLVAPSHVRAYGGMDINDFYNKLYPGSKLAVDDGGITFKSATSYINISVNNGSLPYVLIENDPTTNGWYTAHDGELSLSSVPLPNALFLLAPGLLALAGVRRRVKA